MAHDPYIRSWWRQLRNQARARGLWGVLSAVGLPLVSMILVTPLVRRVFLGFLDEPPAFWPEGVGAVLLRAALVIIGWLSLDVYGVLIRGDGRSVLALLPVDTPRVVRAQLLEVAVSRWWLLVGAAVVLTPIGLAGRWDLWAWSLAALAGAFAVGLTASAAVFLLAVAVAVSPRWAGLLDVGRGDNPRAQAAFIYAPGVVIMVGGVVAWFASEAAPRVAQGQWAMLPYLTVPFVAAGLAAVPLGRLARAHWFRGSSVLTEIDARYASLADPDEDRAVYLEWAIRFLPRRVHRYALADLRHGWRHRRTLVTGAWLIGALALAAGWTSTDLGPPRVAVVVVLGAFLVAAVGVLMRLDEPAFLVAWLPPRGADGLFARLVVLLLYAAPIGGLGALAVWMFRSVGEGLFVLAVAAGAAVAAAVLSIGCARLGRHALTAYAPLATVLAAAMAATVGAA